MRRAGARTGVAALLVGALSATVLGSAPAPASVPDRDAGAGPSGGEVTALLVLTDQSDLGAVRGATRGLRARRAVRALQATATDSQAPLLDRLRVWRLQGSVSRITPLWIVNAISVTATPSVVAELAARPEVARVESDRVDLVLSGSPGRWPDTAAVTSLTGAPPEPNQSTIGAPDLWALGHRGAGVVVASMDTGVDATHPDLDAHWRGGTNSWFDPYGQHPVTPTDLVGHGTATTGVIVGGDGGGTTIGTAPDADWIAAKIFNDAGSATTTAIHQAFQWVLDPDGDPTTADVPQVVNGSWSIGTGPGCDLRFQPDVQALRAAGIVPVFAAGNYGGAAASSVSPANYPESLSVGAITAAGAVAGTSSRGPSTCGGRTRVFPDLVAPGVDIVTTDRYGLYQVASGTSVAAPHVAGALALLLEAAPGRGATTYETALTATAHDLGASGADDSYGLGLVDVPGALAALPGPPPPPPPPPDPPPTDPPGPPTGPGSARPPAVEFGDGRSATLRSATRAGGLRTTRLTGAPWRLPRGARIDGFDRSGTRTFALSFANARLRLPGLGTVHDEDVVRWDGRRWRLLFDGSAHGLGSSRAGVDALDVAGRDLYFSTDGNATVPGVGRRADDADVYRWNGRSFTRAWDASAHGLGRAADVDALVRRGGRVFVSFASARTRVPGLGSVRDEDVVRFAAGRWTTYAVGSDLGLGAAGRDLGALDLP